MPDPVELHKLLIDILVERSRTTVTGNRVRSGDWPAVWGAQEQALIQSLTPDQRHVLARLLESEHQAGVHTTLAALTDLDARLTIDGEPVAHQPTGCESYYDYICRLHDDPWPAHMPDDGDRPETPADRARTEAHLANEAAKDALITDRLCPNCGQPCPRYRNTCKRCKATVGREP